MLMEKYKVDWYLFFIILIPLILLLSNQQWFFPMSGGTDAQYNIAYFFDYGRDPGLFYNYRVVRLSWIIKGWLSYHLFSPIIAHYILSLFELYMSYISFYYIVKILYNKEIAFISSIVFATYTQFQYLPGFDWLYQTHDAVGNTLLTLLFILLAVKTAYRKSCLILAGCFAASAIQNPYTLLAFTGVIFWFSYLNWSLGFKVFLQNSLLLSLGALVTTAIYCGISYSLGGPLLYFTPQLGLHNFNWLWYPLQQPLMIIGAGPRYIPGNWAPLKDLLLHGTGVLFPFFTAIISCPVSIYLAKKWKLIPYNSAIALSLGTFFISFLTFFALHLYGYQAFTLEHVLIAMAPMLFLGICGIIALFYYFGNNATLRWIIGVGAYIAFIGILIYGLDKSIVYYVRPHILSFVYPIFGLIILHLIKHYFFDNNWRDKIKIKPWVFSIQILYIGLITTIFVWIIKNKKLINASLLKLIEKNLFSIDALVTFFYLLLLVLGISYFSKSIRKYCWLLGVLSLYLVLNIYSAMIPFSFYAHQKYYNYQKDNFLAVIDTFKLLNDYKNNSRYVVWFQSQAIPVASLPGQNKFNVSELYLDGAYVGTVFGRYVQPEAQHWGEGSLLSQGINEIPRSQYWKSVLPPLSGEPLRIVVDGGTCAIAWLSTFANTSLNQFWFYVLPNEFKIALMYHDQQDFSKAENTLAQNGFKLTHSVTHKIKEGYISYYVVIGNAVRTTPRQI